MKAEAEIERYKRALGVAVDALRVYADEESYHAITVFIDRPAGTFADDFSRVKGSEYRRPMPGKAARAALRELDKRFGSLKFYSRTE